MDELVTSATLILPMLFNYENIYNWINFLGVTSWNSLFEK